MKKRTLYMIAIGCMMFFVMSACSDKKPKGGLPNDGLPALAAADIELVHLKDTTQFVSDPDGFILPKDKDKVNKLMKRLEKNSQIRSAIVVVGRAKTDDLNNYAAELGELYKKGNNSNRDMVIVVSVEDHQWAIFKGTGMSSELPDSFAAKTMREYLMPHLERNNPNQGVVEMTQELYHKLNKKKDEEI